MDPQASCSSWLKCQNNVYDIIIKSRIDGLCVIPASPWLIGADKTLATEAGAELILKNHLSKLQKEWDFCLIDTPPALGLLSLNALSAAHEVLIPVETRIMALRA